jgi:hydroxymethylpyrimidine pyrophosphatase-like HAD family hydrolase
MFKISKDEIAVFGDSPNDLSMFGSAGLKIAVRNSYPEVLRNADYITDENYNSGLGKAIYKYILN